MRKADKEYELNQFKEAIDSYLKVIGKEPENVEAVSKLADCYRLINDLEEAAEWYQRALSMPGLDPIHVFHYGGVLKSLQRYDEARQLFLNYAEAYPGFGNHYARSCEEAQAMANTPSRYDVRLEYINSSFSDFAPELQTGGVVFASARTDIPRSGDRRKIKMEEGVDNQLFVAERGANDFLNKPEFYHPAVRHDKNEGPISFSADGRWVAFTKNNFKSGVRHIPGAGLELSIYVASRDARGNWSEARPFPYNGAGYSTGYPCFADNGNTLYFASDRPDGYGGFDIFVSKRTGDTWSTPTNLGPVINTPGHELAPFFDGYSLYLSSNWHFGLGGFDLFRAEYENGGWNRIYHLGTGLNSSYDELSLVYDFEQNLGYLVSNRPNGKGAEDIYRFSAKSEEIEFVVLDAITRQPVPKAIIDFSNCGEPAYQTDERGRYTFRVPMGLDCQVVVRKEGYASHAFPLTQGDVSGDRELDILLEKETDRYLGRAINAQTNRSEENVLIRVLNDETGERYEAYTNARGEYSLVLAPNTTYTVTFSKAGFLDLKRKVSTGKGSDKTLLGTVELRPLGMPVDEGGPTPPPDNGSAEESAEVLREGYSVQVAAVFNKDDVDLNDYQSLRNVGNVYTRKEGKAIKIRVGIYPEREQAEAARRQVNQQGFNSAFVVSEEVDSRLKKILLGTSEEEDIPPPPPPPSNRQGYMVRLATYSKPEYFDASKVDQLGVIEEMKKGPYTIMLLSGFATLAEARQALAGARKAGFNSAYIVVEENGNLKRAE